MMKTVLSIFCFVFCTGLANGQNPFDIKTPNKKQDTKVLNNAPAPASNQEAKPIEPNPAPPTNTIGQKQTPPSTNTATTPTAQSAQNASNNQPANSTSSKNIFDIKAGKTNPVIINNPSSNTSQATTSVQPNSQTNQATTPIQATPTSSNSATIINTPANQSATGLEGVQNPFNIKAGSDPNQPTSSATGTPEIVAPKMEDIKEQIKEFKTSAVGSKGGISKNQWFIIYIFLFLLAGIAINFNRSYPVALIKATYNQNQMRILFKDAFKGNHSFIFGILYFIFIVNAGIFLYLAFHIFNVAPLSLLAAIGIVLLVYLVRHFVLFVMGIIFPMTKETTLFSYTIGIYNLTLGIALLFLNVVLSFVDSETGQMLIFSGLTIILVLFIMRQIRGLLSNVPAIAASKFHFIIYLCTVEIAPWLLLSGILLK